MDKSTPFTHPPEGYRHGIRIRQLQDRIVELEADLKDYATAIGQNERYRKALEDVREWVNSRIEPRLHVTLQNILSKALKGDEDDT